MRSIFIILGLVIVCAIAGYFIVEETMRSQQNEAEAKNARPDTGDLHKDLIESQRQLSEASGDLAKRQRAGMIGGAVGGGVGLIAGIGLAMWLDRRKARVTRPPVV